MKRECTEAENRIIKRCTKDILTCPENYAKRVKSNLLPMCLGAIVGLALGGLIAMMVGVAVESWNWCHTRSETSFSCRRIYPMVKYFISIPW